MGSVAIQRVREYVADPPSGRAARATATYLVDRVWPRGIAKADLDVPWLEDVAPSTGLRKWFGHDVARWDGFRERYVAELDERFESDDPADLSDLVDAVRDGDVLLLFDARDTEHNQAVVLADWLRDRRRRTEEP
ncbi:MAG TPA: DUF488 family protein [Nocardioidaceae bacterium]|nr:DUF488 family protein [Nocardioidaceae bacterium]